MQLKFTKKINLKRKKNSIYLNFHNLSSNTKKILHIFEKKINFFQVR